MSRDNGWVGLPSLEFQFLPLATAETNRGLVQGRPLLESSERAFCWQSHGSMLWNWDVKDGICACVPSGQP